MVKFVRFLPALFCVALISAHATAQAQTNFGSVAVGSSASATITVTVPSASSFTAINVVTWGASGLDFTALSGGTCAAAVGYGAGQTCTVNVSFKPQHTGLRMGAVTLANPSNNTFATTFLRGTGTGPELGFLLGDATAIYPTLNGIPLPLQTARGQFSGNLAVDGSGTLYIATQVLNSSGHNIAHGGILKVPSGSNVATLLPARGNKGDTITPTAVRVDGAGNRILTDGSDNAISLPPGASAGTEYQLAGLSSPAIDGAGNLFLNSVPLTGVDHKFVEYFAGDPNNSEKFSIFVNSKEAGSTSSQAVDSAGNLFLLGDFGLQGGSSKDIVTIAKVPASQLADASTCCYATGIVEQDQFPDAAFDSEGGLFVSDTSQNEIQEIYVDGGPTLLFRTPVVDGKELNGPQGLAVDADGNLLIYDVNYGRIVKINRSQRSFRFANTAVGLPSQDSPQSVSVQNVGTSTLSLSSIKFPADFPKDTLFTPVPSDCSASTSLAPGAYCNLYVDFVPQTTGTLSESVVITDNSGTTHTVDVSGAGIGDSVTLSANSLSFGNEAVGYSTATQNVTLTNISSAVLSFNRFSFGQSPEPNFVESNTCGASLAAGASCRIGIRFTPSAAGAATETFSIYNNGVNSTQTIALSGTGIAAVPASLSLSPSSLSFGNEAVGYSTASQNVTVTNTSSAVLYFKSIALTGTNAASFVTSNTCGASLAAGATCRIGARFVPTATGSATAYITLTDNTANSPQTITLSGTGIDAATASLSLSASSLSFGNEAVGYSTASQNVTVTNTSSAVLYFKSIALTGTNAASFVTSNTCGASLAGGASCHIGARFAPTTTGSLTATVTITDNTSTSPQTIALSGTGTN